MSSDNWPSPPTTSSSEEHELVLALYQAQLTDLVNRRNAEYSLERERKIQAIGQANEVVTSEDRLREAVHSAYLDVAKATLDRMLKRADMLSTIAAAAATIYTAVLGFAYSPDSRALSAVGVLPAQLFGLALLMSAFYAGFVSRKVRLGMPLAASTAAKVQHRRLAEFISWVNATALDRGWALQISIVCLFGGISAMPIAFVDRGQPVVATSSLLIVLVGAVFVLWRARGTNQPS